VTDAALLDPNGALSRRRWSEFSPMVERLARLDPFLAIRLRADAENVRLLAWLPSGALIGSTLRSPQIDGAVDLVTQAGSLVHWLGQSDADSTQLQRVDAAWLTGIPPERGWERVDLVPGPVVRDLVGQGARAHQDVVDRQLGNKAADSLLDTAVLLVSNGSARAEVTNRMLSAMTSLSLLPEGGDVVVAVNGRWTRVAAARGSVFSENRRGGLSLA
jgi:hypothetical protein